MKLKIYYLCSKLPDLVADCELFPSSEALIAEIADLGLEGFWGHIGGKVRKIHLDLLADSLEEREDHSVQRNNETYSFGWRILDF